MSYDLRVWCVGLPPEVPCAAGKSWQITRSDARCEPEDVPDEVARQLPGIAYLVDLGLEPIGAPEVGHKALWKHARTVAKLARGVIEDPQTDTTETGRGVKRVAAIERSRDERFSLLQLSWWFTHDKLCTLDGIERFVDRLCGLLPEAMPRRYGTHEPPQHRFEPDQRAPFLRFLRDEQVLVVWYPERPVVGVTWLPVRDAGWIRVADKRRFKCHHFAISLDAGVLAQPGWEATLQHAWRELSLELEPFYGDVRTLAGHIARGRTHWSDSATQQHPVRVGWWTGIPEQLGHAVVVGEPYIELWPEIATREHARGLVFVSTPSWRDAADVTSLIGPVPRELVGRERLARTFPF